MTESLFREILESSDELHVKFDKVKQVSGRYIFVETEYVSDYSDDEYEELRDTHAESFEYTVLFDKIKLTYCASEALVAFNTLLSALIWYISLRGKLEAILGEFTYKPKNIFDVIQYGHYKGVPIIINCFTESVTVCVDLNVFNPGQIFEYQQMVKLREYLISNGILGKQLTYTKFLLNGAYLTVTDVITVKSGDIKKTFKLEDYKRCIY